MRACRLLFAAPLPLLLALFACGAGSASTGPESPAAPSAPATSATPEIHVAPAPDPESATASSSSPGAEPAAPGSPPVAAPLPAALPAASTTVSLTPQDRDVLAMCQGKKDIFTDKELKLLKLADASPNPMLQEQAQTIRARRQEQVNEACERLRQAGKM